MKLFGVTGAAGMGKSATGSLLAERGIPVLDTDLIARQLVELGRPALLEIGACFGSSVLSPDGSLNRKELARQIFGDAGARRKLEAILHPRIREAWQKEVKSWQASNHEQGAVIIPLLFETEAEALFDAVICVACSPESQVKRLEERGWPAKEIQQRLAAQWSSDQKIAKANFVIWTDGSMEVHAEQLDKILRQR